MEKIPNVTLGECECPICSRPALVKTMKTSRAIIVCGYPPDGCGVQIMSRSDVSTQLMAKRIKKWRDGMRAKFLGESAAPAPQNPPPAPEPSGLPPTRGPKRPASSTGSTPRSASAKKKPAATPAPKPETWWDKLSKL